MKIPNKKIGFNYELLDKVEVGVVLTGAEVKSLFAGQASLDEAYVKFVGREAFLLNAHIHPYQFADTKKIDPKRTRKLLLHRKELLSLQIKMQQKNLTIVPVTWYNKGRQIKLEIALARGKKIWQKREAIKKADLARETEAELKNRR
jgi:SsrA-binding protein